MSKRQKMQNGCLTMSVQTVMIGRAALGNPWMIHRTQHYLETGELIPEPTPAENCYS